MKCRACMGSGGPWCMCALCEECIDRGVNHHPLCHDVKPSEHELRRRELAAELVGRPLSRTEGVLLDASFKALATKLGTPEARRAHEQFRELLEEPEVQALAHAVKRWLRS